MTTTNARPEENMSSTEIMEVPLTLSILSYDRFDQIQHSLENATTVTIRLADLVLVTVRPCPDPGSFSDFGRYQLLFARNPVLVEGYGQLAALDVLKETFEKHIAHFD